MRIVLMSWSVLVLAVVLTTSSVWAQGSLENPSDNSSQSGLGIISGWYCQASTIEVVIDGTIRVQASYGTLRGDTQAVCGDANNGFGFLINWNLLGDGTHTVGVLADGQQFGQASFTVATLGMNFLRGANATTTAIVAGRRVTLRWQEALQNFAIVDVESTPEDCDLSYPTVCIPPPPPDLDCADIPYRNFVVRPPDPHKIGRASCRERV